MQKGQAIPVLFERFSPVIEQEIRAINTKVIRSVLDVSDIESQQIQPLLTVIGEVMLPIINDLSDRTLTMEERYYFINKIIEKSQTIPVLFEKFSPLIAQEIGNKNSRVIGSVLDVPAVESNQQFQPLLTYIEQVMPAITNDLNDPTLTGEERDAGGKKNYLIRKIFEKGETSPLLLAKFPETIIQEIKDRNTKVINAILDIPAVESNQQFQPLLTYIEQVMPAITNDLNDPTLTGEERDAGGKKNYLIRKIFEKGETSPLLLAKFPETIIQEIKDRNTKVINAILDIPAVESIEQLQPLLTAIAQVIPSITNLYDLTLTREEGRAGGKKNYIINKILEKGLITPLFLEKFYPAITQEIDNQNSDVISSVLGVPAVESHQQFQPLLTAIDRVISSITNDLNDPTLMWGEREAGGKKNYLIKKIINARQNIPSYFAKFSLVIEQEIGNRNSRVISSVLDVPAVESKQQFQPLLTAIAQVIPSITNDLHDLTLTTDERKAGGKKNYIINKIIEKGQTRPGLFEKFSPVIEQEIRAMNWYIINEILFRSSYGEEPFLPLLAVINEAFSPISNQLMHSRLRGDELMNLIDSIFKKLGSNSNQKILSGLYTSMIVANQKFNVNYSEEK